MRAGNPTWQTFCILTGSLSLAVTGCSGGSNTNASGGGSAQTAPPGQVMVTVTASSTPTGASVTGGGRLLGQTPLSVQVPVPAPTAGQAQQFEFTFQLPGYRALNTQATVTNGTITLNPTLERDGPAFVNIEGLGAGPIRDMGELRGVANIVDKCPITSMQVTLEGTHTFDNDLEITLRGPDRTVYPLHGSRRGRGGGTSAFRQYTLDRAVGHQAFGAWELLIRDRVPRDTGTLRRWAMAIQCRQ